MRNFSSFSRMESIAYGETLFNKSIEAMGVYVSDLMKHLITDPRYNRGPDGKYHHYQEPCSRLEEYVTCHMPRDVAEDVTYRIISRVSVCYTHLTNDLKFRHACEEIAPYILKAVIHPAVKRLDFIRDNWHPTLLEFYDDINGDLIYRTLPLLRDLKVLRIRKMSTFGRVPLEVESIKDTLEEFSTRNYLEADIETLANKCKRIKCLELGGRKHIASNIFDLISRFEFVEELNLIMLSFINSVDLQRILCWLVGRIPPRKASSQNSGDIPTNSGVPSPTREEESVDEQLRSPPERHSGQLKSFGCANVTFEHISLISKFYNLTSLIISDAMPPCSLAPLRSLNQLKNLTLIRSYFSDAEELLIALGSHLICLKLIDVFGTNFNLISQKCVTLECFHLFFSRPEFLILPANYHDVDSHSLPSPDFPRVLTLQLYITERLAQRYVVSRFPNLKKLSVVLTCDDFVLLDSLLRGSRPTSLQELYWGSDTLVIFSESGHNIYKFVRVSRGIVQRIVT